MLLRPQDITRRGLHPIYSELEEPIIQVPNNGSVVLHVVYNPSEEENEGGVVVTVLPDEKYRGDQHGRAQDVVPPGPEGVFLGPFPHEVYTSDVTDCITAYFSSTKGVRVSALRVSRT